MTEKGKSSPQRKTRQIPSNLPSPLVTNLGDVICVATTEEVKPGLGKVTHSSKQQVRFGWFIKEKGGQWSLSDEWDRCMKRDVLAKVVNWNGGLMPQESFVGQ